MAWRLEKAVEHGEIDNSVPGTTTGRIWLRGVEEPLLLSLEGDCWRDLAGARLEFTNPTPVAMEHSASLDPDQIGLVGDMTAAMRVCHIPKRKGEEAHWKNALYLEWFSESNGRVLIEATHYKLRISEHVWRMDEDEDEAQKLANLQAMREFMARVIGRKDREECAGEGVDGHADSSDESLLKLSERVSRAFGEVLEKYGDDPDSERKEAFVMGWDRKLEALAEREEAMSMRMPPYDGESAPHAEEDEDDEDGDGEWSRLMDSPAGDFADDDFYADEEPVVEKSRELCLRAMDLMDGEAGPGTPAYQVTHSLLEISSKLAGALECRDDEDDDFGAEYVLGILRSCLGLINDCLGALQMVASGGQDADHLAELEQLTAEIFSVRDDIVELRREIREEM
ncbi:MAG: hypothetical protein ACNA8L_00640 [Luteolibacter sp.]